MKFKRWTKEEIKFLLKYRLDHSLEEMITHVGHPRGSVLTKLREFGYTWRRKKTGPRKLWTPDEDQFLKNNYGEITTEEIARELNRTRQGIYLRLHKLHLWRYTGRVTFTAPEFHLTECETAYLAGIVDGEGSLSISISRRDEERPVIAVSLAISNTNSELIDWIQTKLNLRNKHIRKSSNPDSKIVYGVSIFRRVLLQNVLLRIFPYLIVKQKLALEILRVLELKKRKGVLHPDTLKAVLKFKELIDTRNTRTKVQTNYLKNYIKNRLNISESSPSKDLP